MTPQCKWPIAASEETYNFTKGYDKGFDNIYVVAQFYHWFKF